MLPCETQLCDRSKFTEIISSTSVISSEKLLQQSTTMIFHASLAIRTKKGALLTLNEEADRSNTRNQLKASVNFCTNYHQSLHEQTNEIKIHNNIIIFHFKTLSRYQRSVYSIYKLAVSF
jgi:hypothetical protein